MKILGLRLCDHDSSVSYFDGEKVFYHLLERSSNIKHCGYNNLSDWIDDVAHWNINPSEIDAICIVLDCVDNPQINTNDNILEEEVYIEEIKECGFECPIYRIDHHYAHLLSAWTEVDDCDSGIIVDAHGDGERSTSIFIDGKIVVTTESDSFGYILNLLGLFAFDVVARTPLDELDIAGKIMALKGYGVHDYTPVGDWDALNLARHWNINDLVMGQGLTKEKLELFYESHVETEEAFVNLFAEFNFPGKFAYVGGVALNTVVNSRLRKDFPNMIVVPHSNDSGLSLGCIEYLRRKYKLPHFDKTGFPYWVDDEKAPSPSQETINTTAKLLSEGKIVGWYQGNGEVGPRALGNRSILMDPTVKGGKDIINSKVKHREYYRPFGASVLVERVSDYFDWEGPSPYMLYVMDTKEPEKYASIAHIDGTCRAQTVDRNDNDAYYDLIKTFGDLTGTYMLLNTSLNDGGKPMCGKIDTALEILSSTEMDALVVGDTIYYANTSIDNK